MKQIEKILSEKSLLGYLYNTLTMAQLVSFKTEIGKTKYSRIISGTDPIDYNTMKSILVHARKCSSYIENIREWLLSYNLKSTITVDQLDELNQYQNIE